MRPANIKHYPVLIERGQDGYFIARVPSLAGCFTQARTYDALIPRAREAIQLYLDVARSDSRSRRKASVLLEQPTFFGIADIPVRV